MIVSYQFSIVAYLLLHNSLVPVESPLQIFQVFFFLIRVSLNVHADSRSMSLCVRIVDAVTLSMFVVIITRCVMFCSPSLQREAVSRLKSFRIFSIVCPAFLRMIRILLLRGSAILV